MQKQIANYQILDTISENGPVSVYLAIHKVLNRKTLLKVHHSDDTKLIKRFEEEARIVADLNHPFIVAIYDYGRTSDHDFYISMEYVEGGNLNEFIEQNDLTIDEKIKLCFNISKSVNVLHKNGYIHRDLKPQNLLVDKNGSVKLTDFGISFHESVKRITPDGKLLGTPLFMSPEQINNLPVTKQSDLYSLGVIYYQVLTGTNPFDAPNFGEIFSKILTHSPSPVSNLYHEIPDWVSELTESLIKKETKQRPESITDVISIFEQYLGVEAETNGPDNETKKNLSIVFYIFPVLIVLFFVFYVRLGDNSDLLNQNNDSLNVNPITQDSSALLPFDKDAKSDQTKITQTQKETINKKSPNKQSNISEQRDSKIFINTYPWCRVYLDYELIDTTPFKDSIVIKPGKYLLSLQNSEYPSWNDSIEIKANKTNIFSYNLDSIFYKLELTVQPWGKVFIDGTYYGTTPLSKPIVLSKKNKTILIENQYYNSYTDTLVWDGQPLISKNIILNEKSKN